MTMMMMMMMMTKRDDDDDGNGNDYCSAGNDNGYQLLNIVDDGGGNVDW